MNRSAPFGTAGRLANLITHDNFLSVGLGVLILPFFISRQSPLTQCWHYHVVCDNFCVISIEFIYFIAVQCLSGIVSGIMALDKSPVVIA